MLPRNSRRSVTSCAQLHEAQSDAEASAASASECTPRVCVVVVNWNGFADTQECLQSLRTVAAPECRIVVVDNGSTDDSLGRLKELHPDVTFIPCAENRGIAAGYNVGIKRALTYNVTHIVVMNNDLVCDAAFARNLVDVAQRSAGCGIVMPKIYYYSDRGIIWSVGGRARGLPSNIVLAGRGKPDGPEFNRSVDLDFAPSCCLLLTRALAEHLPFDERYFFYFDDWDFCLAARALGYRIVLAPKALVWHKVSRSTQNSSVPERWWTILGQSCVRYHRKHYSALFLAAYVLWVIGRETVKGNARPIPAFLRGVMTGIRTAQ